MVNTQDFGKAKLLGKRCFLHFIWIVLPIFLLWIYLFFANSLLCRVTIMYSLKIIHMLWLCLYGSKWHFIVSIFNIEEHKTSPSLSRVIYSNVLIGSLVFPLASPYFHCPLHAYFTHLMFFYHLHVPSSLYVPFTLSMFHVSSPCSFFPTHAQVTLSFGVTG